MVIVSCRVCVLACAIIIICVCVCHHEVCLYCMWSFQSEREGNVSLVDIFTLEQFQAASEYICIVLLSYRQCVWINLQWNMLHNIKL